MAHLWQNSTGITSTIYKCGHCGNEISSNNGFRAVSPFNSGEVICFIAICHNCNLPTFFDEKKVQFPGASIGNKVRFIPDKEVNELFDEAKKCFSINAFTSTVSCCRKLLMNISVSQGSKEGLSYVEYISFLDKSNYIPPNGKEWVNSIKKLGNEANHKIEPKTKKEAELILTFTEMLLRFVYEIPNLLKLHSEVKPEPQPKE